MISSLCCVLRDCARHRTSTVLAALAILGAAFAQPAAAQSAAAPTEVVPPVPFCAAWPEGSKTIDPHMRGLQPGKDGWVFNASGDFALLGWLPDRDLAALRTFVAALRERGTQLAIVVPPPRGLIESAHVDPARFEAEKLDYPRIAEGYDVFVESLRESGAIVPNLREAIAAARAKAPVEFYYHRDIHWRPEGARIAAEALAAAIGASDVYKDLPRAEFATRAEGEMNPRQYWVDALDQVCGSGKTYETATRYVTEKQGGDDAAASLLGDEGVPQVVLVGTSMSFRSDGGDANFGGFLQQAMSVDLLNSAIPGGGLVTSIMSYLYSTDFQSAPPKLLVWEFRPFDPATELEIRQLLGAIAGPCSGDQAVLSNTVQLDRGRTVALHLDEQAAAKLPPNVYLDLSLSDTSIREFDYSVDYADLRRERIAIDLARAQVATNHYFLELPGDQASTLREIAVRPRSPAAGSATVTLCRRPEPAL